ncbi:MAG: diguanylate cyclase [Pyrinomonadaceae bacterium]|nr:diguanylate cyclase [Pyrinomonadaceae bacterium]
MEKFSLLKYNLPTKIFYWLMLSGGLALAATAIYGTLSYSVTQFAVLLVALFVSALVNQHQFTVPRTGILLTAKELIIFWGIIWLGAAGGVLLAAGITAVTYKSAPKDKKEWLFGGLTDLIAAFAAGKVFYFALQSATNFDEKAVGENALAAGWLLLAVAAMAFTHYLFSGLAASVFSLLKKDEHSIADFWKENLLPSAGKYFIGISAAVALHFAFVGFGLAFGLVVLPMTIFGHLAYRLHIKRFEQKTREITEASRIHLATVEALATAIDARDQVGVGHVRRTQIYAVGIGELLGLSVCELSALNAGALLHDIGKLAVPDHILNKPGKLTPAELEKAKIHAAVGASILEKVPFNNPVVPTVKHHHENWDGSGYPDNLKGEDIPLTARVLSVADAYDTLRGARPYRPAISRDEARRLLQNGAGKQFDPQIIDVFLRNLSKFEAEVETQGLSYSLDTEGVGGLHSTFKDDAKSYVGQIKRANREVFTLYELAREFGSSLNLQETLTLFAKKIGELLPFNTCAIYLMDESGEFAKAAYVQGENKAALKNKRVKAGEGATGYVLLKRQPMSSIEPGLDFTHSNFDLSQDYKAMASLPLLADEKLIGAVSIYSYELENYEEEHLRLLETVSRIATDAIAMSLQHAESESRALTDPMTDLPNARSLQMQFEKETARAGRGGTNFQLLMLDLDGFKAVNDTFGHKAGDKLLKGLAKVMTAQLRDYDFLARYAGDEFVAIVPETDAEGIRELCQRIEKAVDEFALPVGEGRYARVGVSIGVGCYPNHGNTLDQIIIHADKAMYAVKAHRKQNHLTKMLPLTAGDLTAENFIVELDESHIISAAIN